MSGDGLICPTCEQRETSRDAHAAGSGSGFGAIGWGVLSLFCNPLFIPSILAITGGFRELRALKATRALGVTDPADSSRHTSAVIAIVLGAVYPVMMILVVGFVFVGGVASLFTRPSYDSYDYGTYDDYGASDDYGGSGAYGGDPYGGGSYGSHGDTYGAGDEPLPDPLPAVPANTFSLDASRPLGPQLAGHVRAAEARGLRPYLYAHADWCPPCRAIDAHRADPRMARAFENTYIIEVDIEVADGAELEGLGFVVGGIPAFFGVRADGTYDGRTITGGAWGEDIPENMAPPLDRFFHAGS